MFVHITSPSLFSLHSLLRSTCDTELFQAEWRAHWWQRELEAASVHTALDLSGEREGIERGKSQRPDNVLTVCSHIHYEVAAKFLWFKSVGHASQEANLLFPLWMHLYMCVRRKRASIFVGWHYRRLARLMCCCTARQRCMLNFWIIRNVTSRSWVVLEPRLLRFFAFSCVLKICIFQLTWNNKYLML